MTKQDFGHPYAISHHIKFWFITVGYLIRIRMHRILLLIYCNYHIICPNRCLWSSYCYGVFFLFTFTKKFFARNHETSFRDTTELNTYSDQFRRLAVLYEIRATIRNFEIKVCSWHAVCPRAPGFYGVGMVIPECLWDCSGEKSTTKQGLIPIPNHSLAQKCLRPIKLE